MFYFWLNKGCIKFYWFELDRDSKINVIGFIIHVEAKFLILKRFDEQDFMMFFLYIYTQYVILQIQVPVGKIEVNYSYIKYFFNEHRYEFRIWILFNFFFIKSKSGYIADIILH